MKENNFLGNIIHYFCRTVVKLNICLPAWTLHKRLWFDAQNECLKLINSHLQTTIHPSPRRCRSRH